MSFDPEALGIEDRTSSFHSGSSRRPPPGRWASLRVAESVRTVEATVALSRAVAWRLLLVEPLEGGSAVAVTLLAAAAVGAIAAIGSAGNDNIAILYLVPPLLATLLVGRDVGIALSAAAAVAWALTRQAEGSWRLVLDASLRCGVTTLLLVLVCALRATAARARRSDERTATFLGLAAHQLRTPIAGVRASADALLALPPAAPDSEHARASDHLLGNLVAEAARLGALVDDLLTIASLEGGEAVPASPTDLATCVQAGVDGLSARAPHLTIGVTGLDAPAMALAHAESCRHILEHLLGNAARHARGRVDIVVESEPGRVLISVSDDGPGLPAGSEQAAFEPFVSLDGRGGSGLGLPLSRGLARNLGGDLWYERQRFVLSLPTAGPPSATGDAPLPPWPATPAVHRALRLLDLTGHRGAPWVRRGRLLSHHEVQQPSAPPGAGSGT